MITPGRAAGGVAAVAALLLGFYVFVPRDFYTGTNSVRTRAFLITLDQTAKRACFPGLKIPAGTGRMEFELQSDDRRPPLDFELAVGGETYDDAIPGAPAGSEKVAFSFPETPSAPAEQPGRACVTATGPGRVVFGGVTGIKPGERSPTVDGEPVGVRAAIWYRPPAGEQSSIAANLNTLFERMALFRPSWVGAWTYWLLFLGIAPLLAFAAIRVVVRPERRRLALLVFLLGAANAAVWAHVTPTFDTPDESEHFAYLQSLAERGEAPDAAASARPPWSEQERLLIDMTRIFDGNETADGKPPWLRSEERLYETFDTPQLSRTDGGGGTPATASHSPLFYSLGLPAYFLAGDSILDKLVAARLMDALLGGLIAACAVLLVLELAPGRRGLAAAAGVAVAFQPMFAFMSGSYNNDMGVNAAAAGITLLLVRLLRRGFAWPTVLGLGVLVGLAPLLKGTGYALFPPALAGLALAAWRYRRHWREVATGVALALAAVVVVSVVWGEISDSIGRGAFTTPNGAAPVAGTLAAEQPGGAVSYFWQVFLPRLPGMHDHWVQTWPAFNIFGERGWGAFGWYAVTWGRPLYVVIMLVLLALTALGLVALARRGEWVRRSLPEVLVLATVVATVLGVMIVAYYAPEPQGGLYPQQGRYVFPAITALAALFVGSTTAAGRRFAGPLRAGLVTAVVCLGYASLWLVLAGFYFAA